MKDYIGGAHWVLVGDTTAGTSYSTTVVVLKNDPACYLDPAGGGPYVHLRVVYTKLSSLFNAYVDYVRWDALGL